MEGYDICSILLHGIMGFANHWRAKLWNHCPVFIGSYLIGNHIKFHYFLIWREKKHPQNCLFGKDIFTPKNPQIVGFCIYIFKIFMGGGGHAPPDPPGQPAPWKVTVLAASTGLVIDIFYCLSYTVSILTQVIFVILSHAVIWLNLNFFSPVISACVHCLCQL